MMREHQTTFPWPISAKMDFILWGECSEEHGLEVDFSWNTAHDYRVIFSAKLLSFPNYNYGYNYCKNYL